MKRTKLCREEHLKNLQKEYEELIINDFHIAEAILNKRTLDKDDLEKCAQEWNKKYEVKILVRDSKVGDEDLQNPKTDFILCNDKDRGWFLMFVTSNRTVRSIYCPDCAEFSALASLVKLKILLKLMENQYAEIDCEKVLFCDYQRAIKTQLITLLDCYLEALSSNKCFIDALTSFFEKLESIEEISNVKNACVDKTKIKQFVEDFCKEDDTTLNIVADFPNEMKVFTRIFELLQYMAVDNVFFQEIIGKISKSLAMDPQKLISYYKINQVENEDSSKKVKTRKEEKTIFSIDEIMKSLPKVKNEDTDSGVKHWRELLEELREEFSLKFYALSKKIFKTVDAERKKSESWLKKFVNFVKDDRLPKIRNWAESRPKYKDTMDDVFVKLDQAFFIITGQRLRYTQILALLVFCCDDFSEGRLCQIQTGEGKTIIVALVAIFKALQGHKVDIITSSPILAYEAAKEMEIFYNVFNVSVDSNVDYNNQSRGGYSCDVLYGTIGGFQFDYLRDQIDGLNIRRSRNFDFVILDEVDSMLVDNGEHIAQIASPFPGMECLRYLYLKIWDKAKEGDADEETILNEMKEELENNLKHLVPQHLRDFVNFQLKYWVENAIYAKNFCHEFKQYRIQGGPGGQMQVVPIDFLNTGVAMKNLVWSSGLTQFIQLKHYIDLTFENLTSCFISNIGFIRKYEKKNIFGLSGTLGSHHEQYLLYDIYEVNFKILPTYKTKNFVKYEGHVAKDELNWKLLVASSAIIECERGRATLIICKTQDDVFKLRAIFHHIKNPTEELKEEYRQFLDEEEDESEESDILKLIFNGNHFNLRIYSSEEDVVVTKSEVGSKDIILATNIAGRGTDFKTSEELEKNGGLHVCVSFLPKNQRVEDQAFGRTSRQGKTGSAQLVIRREEVEEMEMLTLNQEIKPEEDLVEAFGRIFENQKNYDMKKLEAVRGVVAEDEIRWKLLVAALALQKCENGKAVLIVCKSQVEVAKLEKMFQCIRLPEDALEMAIYQKDFHQKQEVDGFDSQTLIDVLSRRIEFNIRIYSNERTEIEVKPGDIILVRNFHGSRKGINISEELEENGGLHVSVTFLPKNNNFFGRGLYRGISQNLQFIVKRSEIKSCESVDDSKFKPIIKARDLLEEQRLKEIMEISVKQLTFKDDLFDHFVTDFRNLREKYKEPKYHFLLEDYKERFALWFEMDCKNIVYDKTAREVYEIFKGKARTIADGMISHNPFNSFAAYNYLSQRPNLEEEAKKKLTEALRISEGVLMHGTYLKLAEHSIDNAGQISNRIKNMFKKMFFMEVSENEKYKEEALESLTKAKEILDEEIKHLESFLESLSLEIREASAVKFAYARLCYLRLFHSNANEQIEKLIKCKSSEKDVVCQNKLSFDSKTLLETSKEIVLEELRHVGLDSFSSLTLIHEVPDFKIDCWLTELMAAISALGLGYVFPPILPRMIIFAVNLIVDVLREIVMEMLTGGEEEFNQEKFIYRKITKIAAMAVVAEGSLISDTKSVKVSLFLLRNVIAMCTKRLDPEFRQSHPVLVTVMEGFVDFVDDYNLALDLKNLTVQNWGPTLDRMNISGLTKDILKTVSKHHAIGALTKTSNYKDLKKAMAPVLYDRLFKELVLPQVRSRVAKNTKLKKKLMVNKMKKIDETLDKYLHSGLKFNINWQEIIEFVGDVAIEYCDSGNFAETVGDVALVHTHCTKGVGHILSLLDGSEFKESLEKLCLVLEEELEDEGEENNVVELICERIAVVVFEKPYY